ncbi:unnamed protein product, partial [Sphacelaria rigidula]
HDGAVRIEQAYWDECAVFGVIAWSRLKLNEHRFSNVAKPPCFMIPVDMTPCNRRWTLFLFHSSSARGVIATSSRATDESLLVDTSALVAGVFWKNNEHDSCARVMIFFTKS